MVKLVQILAASFLFSLTVFACAEDYGIDVTNTSFKFEKFELTWTSNCRTAVKNYRIYFENGIERNNMYSNVTYTILIIHSTVEFNLGAKYMFTIFDSESASKSKNCKSKTFLIETPVETKISASNVSFDKIDISFENCPEATHYSLRNCISKPCIYSRNNTITSPIHMTNLPPNTQNRITIEFQRHDKAICLSKGLYVDTPLANIQVMPQIFISHDISLNVKWEPEYTATIEYYKILITKDNILVISINVTELSYSASFDAYSTDGVYKVKIQGLNNSLLISEGEANIKDVQIIEPSIEPDLGVCTNGELEITFRVNNLSDKINNLFFVIITDDAREPEQKILSTFSKSGDTRKWIALERNIGPKNSIVDIIIGDNSTVITRFGEFTNHPFLFDKKYHIIPAVYSKYGNLTWYQQRPLTTTCPKFEKQTESPLTDDPEILPPEDNLSILIISIILLMIVIIVVGAAFYVYRNKLRPLEHFENLLPLFKEDDFSNNLSIGDLDKFLRSQNAGQTLNEEYKKVPWKQKPVDGRMFPSKNRYENVLPVRKTRVYLREMTNLATQYINANYIAVGNSENNKPYIATQGPIPETFGDFWRMIWEQKADIIVMLTNLQERGVNKCHKYWPDDGETGTYGEFVVHCKKIYTFSEYECRFFLMQHSDAKREITQFHYTRWPDHQVPLVPHAVVDFVRKVRECGVAPVVHCSAGVGRTETFILCNLVSEMGMQTGMVDIPKVLGKIRECRSNTLNDNEQYKLCYCVTNELLNGRDTSMSLDQFQTINLASIASSDCTYAKDNDYWLDVFDRKVHPDFERNTRKNRNRVPYKSCRVPIFLPRNIVDDYNCEYVNAVNVDENMICTQQPLPCTVGDFWRLVVEKKASVILSLHGIDPENTSSIVYWPTSVHAPLDPVNFLSINLITKADEGAFDLMLLQISNLQTQETNHLHLMNFKSWHHEAYPRENDFLSFYGTYLKIVKRENMVLTCIDGAKGCGLFLSYLKIKEQINREQVFDGCGVVRALRYSRDDFMQNFNDFNYIYNIIQRELIGASHIYAEIATYSNIN